MRVLTPYELCLLLHTYYSPSEHISKGSPAYDTAIPKLIDLGVIKPMDEEVYYQTTDLGLAWVILILSTPVPVTGYLDPRNNEVINP